ncbi:MAG: aminotransferase class V-fold PLP-dependent enzyme, partial [Clostridiales bacterium]|nr:aminotransferase class V-fold PLP-dependent enzyme [Clostridiales bacterium]
MIYLDNAATTWPKPPSVMQAVEHAMHVYGANPGRSGYQMSMQTAEEIYRCRQTAAELFHADGGAECVAFTLNCTHALNFVLKGILNSGDHVVVSNLEHNAMMRPLHAMKQDGISFSTATVVPGNDAQTVRNFAAQITPSTKMIACMHASNVFGVRLPIREIGQLAKKRNLLFLVDAAQTAGIVPIDMQACGIDFLCMPGHKGLYGPMGTGMLITSKGPQLKTIIEGGTGSISEDLMQPAFMPDRFESGTINVVGAIGLRAGMDFVKEKGIPRMLRQELSLTTQAYDALRRIPSVRLYTRRPSLEHDVPVLSFNVAGMDSAQVGSLLDEKGIAVRAGLHCAPLAHQTFGTIHQG